MLPQLYSAKCLDPSPNSVILPPERFRRPDFHSFGPRMQQLPSKRTTSNHHELHSLHIWCENQKSSADFCPSMNSRCLCSDASWHRWNKSSAAKFNDMSPLQQSVAMQPSFEGSDRCHRHHVKIYPKLQQIGHRLPDHLSPQRTIAGRCTKREIEFQCHEMDFRGRDNGDQPDTFTSQRHNSIESKIHVVLDRSGARLPLVNMPVL